MKKSYIISTIFFFGLFCATQFSFAYVFPDVPDNAKNAKAIQYLKEQGIIKGYPDNTFKPHGSINRAEMLKILIEGRGMTPDQAKYKNCFPDIKTEWFAKYVCYAKSKGWIKGYSDGTFRPAQTVNKVEAIKMVIEVNEMAAELPADVSERPYLDTDKNQWYSPYLALAKTKGLLEETGTLFNPDSPMLRGGMSEVIYRKMRMDKEVMNSFPAGEYAEIPQTDEPAPPPPSKTDQQEDDSAGEEIPAGTIAAGCCMPGCMQINEMDCSYSNGTWFPHPCLSRSECQMGCCHPPCTQLAKWECEMKTGEGHWCKGSCESCAGSICSECRKGCCVPVNKQLQKWYCDQSVGEGNWQEGLCGDWKIDETLVHSSPPEGTEAQLMGFKGETEIGRLTKITRTITAKGQPLKPADRGKAGYETEWEMNVQDKFDLFTKSPARDSTFEKDRVVSKTVCNWTRKPSFVSEFKLRFSLDPKDLGPVWPEIPNMEKGGRASMTPESCYYDPGEVACTYTTTFVREDGSVSETTNQWTEAGLDGTQGFCDSFYSRTNRPWHFSGSKEFELLVTKPLKDGIGISFNGHDVDQGCLWGYGGFFFTMTPDIIEFKIKK